MRIKPNNSTIYFVQLEVEFLQGCLTFSFFSIQSAVPYICAVNVLPQLYFVNSNVQREIMAARAAALTLSAESRAQS